jgi:hypothetical protein
MRGVVVFVLMGVLVACGDASSGGGAPTIPAPAAAPQTVLAVAPPTTAIADTAEPATTEVSGPVTTSATVAPVNAQATPSGDGLGESIGVSDSVTIIVSDPSD